ncbi:MAG: hypothetical protein Q9M89_03345 [Persephonella sp.]|nr:hypothetical protein [Persephonella sp.]
MRSIAVISARRSDIPLLEAKAREKALGFKVIGQVIKEPELHLKIGDYEVVESMEELKTLWKNSLKNIL